MIEKKIKLKMPEQTAEAETPVIALLSDFNTKLRDIEERQKLIKDRVLLIGENLVNSKEESSKEISELKIKTENLEREIIRIKDTLSSLMEEIQNLARKSEVEILQRQFKMFQPLMRK
jgi:replicative DNA helicase